MAVLIRAQRVEQKIRELAKRTGKSLTEMVESAVDRRLAELPLDQAEIADRRQRIAAILAEFDAMPTVDDRTADEILGYNEHGHFD
jgi:antitoxin VapB